MCKVKICGVTNSRDFNLAASLGADYVGFIFYPSSPRYVIPETVRRIKDPTARRPLRIGVFVDEEIAVVRRIYEYCRLDRVQLHGDESPEYCRRLGLPFWKTLKMRGPDSLEALPRYPAEAILLDAFHPRFHGGSGCRIPLCLVQSALESGRKIVVAGGIGCRTVHEVMAQKPYAIDICSSVEKRPGKKCPQKMRRLFAAIAKSRKEKP